METKKIRKTKETEAKEILLRMAAQGDLPSASSPKKSYQAYLYKVLIISSNPISKKYDKAFADTYDRTLRSQSIAWEPPFRQAATLPSNVVDIWAYRAKRGIV